MAILFTSNMQHYTSTFVLLSLSCVWLFCDPMDHSPPGSFVRGLSQARILEWAVISSSRGSSQPKDWTHVSCIGRQILYHWATTEALTSTILQLRKKIKFKKPNILIKEILFSTVSLCCFVFVLFISLFFLFVWFSAFYIYLLTICWGKYNAFKKRYRYSPTSECNGENNNLI